MKRKITESLIKWKNRRNRKPLIIRGARQVGKTYIIDDFAGSNFENYLKVNLEEKPELKSVFSKQDPQKIIEELSILYEVNIIPEKTLLFLDEIQACPQAITSLRYFYEKKPDLHVIAAGSLLDHTLREFNYSMPVGRVEFFYMYPLSFKEFLLGFSQNKLIEYINNFKPGMTFSEAIHKKLLEYLRLYLFVGGMPEAVQTYINQNNPLEVERIHSNILTALQYDFAKYGTKKQQEYLITVLRYSANNIGKKVKYVNVDRNGRSKDIKKAFERLELSRIISLIRKTNASGVLLTNNISNEIYKPLFLDIGLVNHLGGIKLINIDKILTTNEGALAEQFIGQELLALPEIYKDSKLFYWAREEKNSNAEIDYIYQHQNHIIPIEVKAGTSGTLKSLQVYLFEKKIKTGVRFNIDIPSLGDFKTKVTTGKKQGELNYRLLSLPLYMCSSMPGLLKKICN